MPHTFKPICTYMYAYRHVVYALYLCLCVRICMPYIRVLNMEFARDEVNWRACRHIVYAL